MEEIINTDSITLDFDPSRNDEDVEEYRLSVFDKYGHYLDEIYLSKTHLKELFEGLQTIDLRDDDDL